MSTISDALKKAQQQRAIRDPERWTREEPTRPEPVPPRMDPPVGSPTPSVVGRVLIVVALVLGMSVVVMQCGRGGVKGGEGAKGSGFGVQAGGGGRMAETTNDGRRPSDERPVDSQAKVVETGMPVVAVAVPVKVAETNKVAAPVVESGPLPPEPKLVGIFYSETNPVAIINGMSVKEGESVGGYVVVKIMAEAVILKARNQEITLRMR